MDNQKIEELFYVCIAKLKPGCFSAPSGEPKAGAGLQPSCPGFWHDIGIDYARGWKMERPQDWDSISSLLLNQQAAIVQLGRDLQAAHERISLLKERLNDHLVQFDAHAEPINLPGRVVWMGNSPGFDYEYPPEQENYDRGAWKMESIKELPLEQRIAEAQYTLKRARNEYYDAIFTKPEIERREYFATWMHYINYTEKLIKQYYRGKLCKTTKYF